MLPQKTDPRWSGLLTGSIPHQFKAVAAGLCVSRHQRALKKNISPAAITAAIDDVYDFFKRYETVMQDDISKLFR
jgi:hypothetical protein